MRVCIIGHKRMGKDTMAEALRDNFGLTFQSSSQAASDIFIYDELKEKHGYTTPEECFEDRVNHRKEWHDLICKYNADDKTALARGIMENSDIYVGMRSDAELDACLEIGLFDLVIGVYDPRKPEEDKSSFDIDIWSKCDFIIPNGGTLDEFYEKVNYLYCKIW
tara:strand:+ start:5664 stop:6155 length:492 start_codon:yes stop_codon:yes gene_type:complete